MGSPSVPTWDLAEWVGVWLYALLDVRQDRELPHGLLPISRLARQRGVRSSWEEAISVRG